MKKEPVHSRSDLAQMQSLPLSAKIRMTKNRIREWYEYYEGDVFVSFSGGKDSTVLLHIAREIYPDIKAMFIDTGLEYPEVREAVKRYPNVDWIKPKKTFKQVVNDYGYPFPSKEVANVIKGAKNYLKKEAEVRGIEVDSYVDFANRIENPKEWTNQRMKILLGTLTTGGKTPNNNPSKFTMKKWAFMLDADWDVSEKCCDVMKKAPSFDYIKTTGLMPIMGTMASESHMRRQKWLQEGCNVYDSKHPASKPMSFWTEQDVLLYLYINEIQIPSVYGEIVSDGPIDRNDVLSKLGIFDTDRPLLHTTGVDRTGCMFCLFGITMENDGPNRLQQMKASHPKQYEYLMKPVENGGLGYKEKIDWINEKSNLDIKY